MAEQCHICLLAVIRTTGHNNARRLDGEIICALHDRRQRKQRGREKGRKEGKREERRERKERERGEKREKEGRREREREEEEKGKKEKERGRGKKEKKRRERIYLDMKCQNVVYSHNRAKNAVSVVIFVHIVSQIRQKFLKFLVISVIICTFVTV